MDIIKPENHLDNRHQTITLTMRVFKFLPRLLAGILMFIIGFVVFMPVILLPITTSTPVPVCIALVIFDTVILIYLFRTHLKYRGLLVIAGFVVVTIIGTIVSQYFATTPPITDNNGNTVPDSIAVLEKIELNGTEQWITIRGKNVNNPVLLYLGIGGPGAGGFPATFTSLSLLEEYFVVVNWDQPGTGKSYNAARISTLNTQRFVDDAYMLSEKMRKRFGKEKIYVMGLSWGTIIGINLIEQHPDLFHAYVGNGQMVNTVENDRFGYNLALKISEKKKDFGTVNKLKQYGPPPYEGSGLGLKYMAYNDVLFEYMGSPTIPMVMLLVPQFAREYGYIDKINFDRGLYESFLHLYPQLKDMDFAKQANKLDVPVYFLVGKKDVNAVASIVERYYNVLEAPYKELIWVESGHGATAEEIKNVLVDRVLVQNNKSN